MITVEMDKAQLAKVEFMLAGIEGGTAKVLMRAINNTLSGVQTDLNKETRKILNITASRIKKDVTISKATSTRLCAQVSSAGRPVGLTNFTGTKQRAKGVSVSVRKDTPRSIIRGAFIAKGLNDNEHVFWRKWHSYKNPVNSKIVYAKLPAKYKLPIKTLYGPRIQDIQGQTEVIEPVQAAAGVRLRTRIDHELTYFLRKYNG
ncbi:MAG: phage tail protein [Bacteroidales bacterium]|nr:phage tail protein [Bacteroidales bacterium]